MSTGKYTDVNGIKMYYEIHGAGEPLVLIHGGGSNIEITFGRILPLFAKDFKVLAIELQAYGHASDRNAPETFEQDADDVAALLDFNGWDKNNLKKITAPALIINTDKDVVLPEHAIKISRLISNAQLIILPGMRGGLLMKAPQHRQEVTCLINRRTGERVF